jgi:GABA(A) receptor-associated protein
MSKAFEFQIKREKSFEERYHTTVRILQRYPGRVPIYIEKAKGASGVVDLEKNKYLVPREFTMGQFLFTVRKRLSLKPSEAIFVFVVNGANPQGILANTSTFLSELYNNYADEDGMLYMVYNIENTYG